jgi:hypothetical protein
MAKKAELLEEAQKLGLEVSEKNTVAEIEAALLGAAIPTGVEGSSENNADLSTDAKDDETEKTTAKAGKRSAKALKEADEKAEEIAQDAELSIFRPILARLEEIYTKENEDTLTQNETTLLKKTGIELENGAPSENIKQESVATEQINRDTLLEEVENPLLIPQQPKTNLVQTKLTETFTIPKTTTTTTPTPPIQKSVDPYREPIA